VIPSLGDAGLRALLSGTDRPRWSGRAPEAGEPAILQLAALSFEASVREALLERGAGTGDVAQPVEAEIAPTVRPTADPEASRLPARPATPGAGAPPREASVIAREAQRTGIDPSVLVAIRRVENGSPGKEFGILAVPAADLDAQARVAANTVRNTLIRFERGGGTAVDPATGRYTETFLRFLSARYAPVGAANDPCGLNRHHAANLVAIYRKTSAPGEKQDG
jgi:hypothetical protein